MRSLQHFATSVIFAALTAMVACDPSPKTNGEELPFIDFLVHLDPPAVGYQVKSVPVMIEPMSEYYNCSVVRIEPHADEHMAWITSLESLSSKHSHHMNVNVGLFSPGDFILPGMAEGLLGAKLGAHECKSLGNLMEDQNMQTLYPSQREHQKGDLPKGVGFALPLPMVVIMEHHYINHYAKPVSINAVLNIGTMPESEVKEVATAFAGGITNVSLAPNSRKIEAKTCAVQRDVKMFAISSHSHERAGCFSMNLLNGEKRDSDPANAIDPTPFFINKDWESPPIMFLDKQGWTGHQPLAMKKGDGIHWACHYTNPTTREVRTGPTSADEMCIFVAMGYPSALSVEDVKSIIQSKDLNELPKLMDVVPCHTVHELESPWVDAGIAYSLSDDKPLSPAWRPSHQGEDHDACPGYEPTLD
jgi:hypothetical protein